jgi:large subunit ribosomal protein L23
MNDPYSVIKTVVVSEKGNSLTETANKYTFKVDKKATKIDVSRAVKAIWGVTPKSVNTINCLGKQRRKRTKIAGSTPSFKKAIVTLKPDDKIDIY